MDFKEIFDKACNTPHNIEQHLPKLYELASQVKSVTELGVDIGMSTRAFLYARPEKLTSIDIVEYPNVREYFDYCQSQGLNYQYIIQDDLTLELEPTDLLFIDSLHTYDHLKKELELHAGKANKYIVFHDTVAFGTVGEGHSKGLLPAIDEFLEVNKEWKIVYDVDFNNGLRVLEKITDDNT